MGPERAALGSDNKISAYGLGWAYELSKHLAPFVADAIRQRRACGQRTPGRLNNSTPSGLTAAGDNKFTELVAGGRHRF